MTTSAQDDGRNKDPLILSRDKGELGLSLPPSEGPVIVHTAFKLLSINSVDDEAETFEFSGALSLRWKDERLAFDPATSGTREKVYQGAYQVTELAAGWYPQVVLANASGMEERSASILRVASDGTCRLVEVINAVAESKLDLHRFPFDKQRLQAVFEVLGFDSSEVVLELEPYKTGKGDIGNVRLSQWEVGELIYACRTHELPEARGSGKVSTFEITLDLERRSLSMMRLVVVPLFLIVVLSWAVFWMDRSSLADRMSVSFVGILTAVSYQILINDILPDIGYATLIHGFVTWSFFIMCITGFINLWVSIHDRNGRESAGDHVDRMSRWGFPLIYVSGIALLAATTYILY